MTTKIQFESYARRQRSFELYEERGREDGHEVDDWLRAEEEITRKKIRAVGTS